jgi:protein-tyrosine phosphatase
VEKERRIVEGLGMRFVNIPLRGYQTPSDAHIQSALAELDSARKSNKPAFVHCRLGKDRTGTVIACYRILREGWKPAQALQEARSLGMSVRQRKMQRYVLKYQPPAAD